jgi:sulfate transport system permease protein
VALGAGIGVIPLKRWREPSVLPGFGPALGFTLFYLSLIVLIPLAALIARPWENGLDGFIHTVTDKRVTGVAQAQLRRRLRRRGGQTVFGLICWPGCWCATLPRQAPARRLRRPALRPPTAVAGIA